MEIKAELLKPYTEDERIEFIVEQNHRFGYMLQDTETGLVALGYTEEEKAEQERVMISQLFLTGADVERAIYQDKGMDFDDVIALLQEQYSDVIDIKAVKIELKANNFYRGNPYVTKIGHILGYNDEDLDCLFLCKEFPQKSGVEND